MEKSVLLIINPKSGTVRIKTDLFSVTKLFSDSGYKVRTYFTKCRGDAVKFCENLSEDIDAVVCCGGDGTLNETITGLVNNQKKYKLGYLPSGTLNEWSSGLGIDRNLIKAAKTVIDGNTEKLDIGKFGDKYFAYTASFGAFTDASYSTNQDTKNILGQAAYFFEGIKSLGNIKPVRLKVTADGETFEGEYIFGAVSNSLSLGGVLKFDSSLVKLNDGLFEVLLVKNPKDIIELSDIIDGLLKKDFLRPGISFLHAKSVTVTSESPVNWTLDGEHALSENTVFIENLNKAIDFYIPEKE